MSAASVSGKSLAPDNSIDPANVLALRDWLRSNHAQENGVWLVINKKSSGQSRIVYSDVVDAVLCYGWIDSKVNKLDEQRSMLWLSPRKAKSSWSKVNKEKVEKLIASGAMQAAGFQKIEAAKADGSWTALDGVEALEIPLDLEKALKSVDGAANYFFDFPRSVKRNILEWIQNAKKPETRAKRISETVQLAGRNERANQWREKQK